MRPITFSLTPSIIPPTTFSVLNPTRFHLTTTTKFIGTPLRPFVLTTQSSSPFSSINASSATFKISSKPSAADVSRTIMELSSTGTLSAISIDGWPLGIGVRFVVDSYGTPALCLNEPDMLFAPSGLSSLHVQLVQSRSRTRQCTLLGNLEKIDDGPHFKKLCALWEKKFGKGVDEGLLYVIEVDRILQLEDFNKGTVWVTSSDYSNAKPDPLRNFAEKVVYEINSQHAEDVIRLCRVHVNTQFQIADAKLIWLTGSALICMFTSLKEFLRLVFLLKKKFWTKKALNLL